VGRKAVEDSKREEQIRQFNTKERVKKAEAEQRKVIVYEVGRGMKFRRRINQGGGGSSRYADKDTIGSEAVKLKL